MSGRVRGPGRVRTAGGSGSAPWWPAADLLVLAALVIVGSVLLVPVYGSAAPVLATAVGAAVSVVVLLLVDRFDLPGWLSLAGIAVLAVPIGSLLVAPDLRLLGVLPSAAGMRTVLAGLLGGWRDLLTVAVPTGVAGALLVPPLVIGIVGTGLAGAAAMSGRRPLALIFPGLALVLFALFGAVAVDPLTVPVITAFFLVAGMGWVLWAGARMSRRANAQQHQPASAGSGDSHSATGAAPSAGRTAGSITRQALAARRIAIAGAVLAVAAVVGTLTATAVTPGRAALREAVELPVDPAVFASPLSTFRTFTKEQRDITLMTETGLAAGARLRLASLDSYDGRQFTASDNEGPFVRIGRERPATGSGTPTTVAVTMQGYSGSFLPLPGPLGAVDFAGDRAAALTEDLRYSAAAETGLLPGGWQPGDQYTVLSTVPPQPSVDQLSKTAAAAVPSATTAPLPDLLRSKASSYSAKATTAAGRVEAIRAGLTADGLFSHGDDGRQSAAGHGLDRMTAMLTAVPMVGDQEQYATLMALMVRSIGLPARVAVGFVAPPGASTGGTVPLRGSDISAWVEVPFDGYGWVAFDPSPDPNKLPDDAQQQSQTERRAVSVEVPPALPQAQPDTVDTENADQRPDDAESDAPVAPPTSSMLETVLVILGWVALLTAIALVPLLLILGLKATRRRRRKRAEHPRDQITGGWDELLDTAIDAGYRPAPWLTRTETAADLRHTGVLQVDWLAPAADAAQFSPGPVNPDRASGYWREVDDRSAELLGGLSLWRRWRARLSLASMRRMDRRAG